MYIYFDRNGTIKEVINDESIRRGSNDYNKIYCYLEGNPDIDDIWYLQKNPDGTLTNEVSFVDNIVTKAIPYDSHRDMKYFQDFEEYQFYVFTLSSSYLLQSGLVVATIRVEEDNTMWALGELTFNVQANIVNSDNDITQSQYDYLLLSYASRTLNEQTGSDLNALIKQKVDANLGTQIEEHMEPYKEQIEEDWKDYKEQVDGEIETFKNDVNDNIDDFKDEVNEKIENQNETISGLGQLQPNGTASSSTILGYTYNRGIWVGTDNRHWYYWNGTKYVDGGDYLANDILIDNALSNTSTNTIQNKVITSFVGKTQLIFEQGNYDASGNKENSSNTVRLVTPYHSKGNEYIYNGLYNIGYKFNVFTCHKETDGTLVVENYTSRYTYEKVYLENNKWYLFSFQKGDGLDFSNAELVNLNNNVYIQKIDNTIKLEKIMNNHNIITFDGSETWGVSGTTSENGLYNFYTFSKPIEDGKKSSTIPRFLANMLIDETYLTNGIQLDINLMVSKTIYKCFGYLTTDNSFFIRTNAVSSVNELVAYLQEHPITVMYETVDKLSYEIKPTPVIFDTDWWTDVDDAMAIRVLLWAEREGMIDILGFGVNAVNNNTAKSLSRFLDYEGRGDLPFMISAKATDYSGSPSYFQTIINNWNYGKYNSNSDCPYTVASTYYINVLNSLPDGEKCDIICVGYLNNLADLLNASGGVDLVSKKVRKIFIMGGKYPSGSENNFNRSSRARGSAYVVCTKVPDNVPIIFLGFEVGDTILCGGTIKDTLGTDDLIYKCLIAHGGSSEGNNGRSGWDPLTVLLGVFDDEYVSGYRLVRGTNVVDQSTGANTFTENNTGHHYYVVKKYPDNWYQYQVNKILEKIAWKSRKLGKIQYES